MKNRPPSLSRRRCLACLLAVPLGACGDAHSLDAFGPALGAAAPLPTDLSIAWLPAPMARFATLLVEAGRRHGVDPETLAIVALVESGGWAAARSPSGARGLMQVMPATGRAIAAERGIDDHATKKLLEPAYNVDFGSWYLGQQLMRFGTGDAVESVERAAAAYNGGPGRLRRHLDDGASLSDETLRYRGWVGQMWQERRGHRSKTFETWREAGGWRLLAKAEREMANAAVGKGP
jgi:soluble lytic murein transglycosylase-like protein